MYDRSVLKTELDYSSFDLFQIRREYFLFWALIAHSCHDLSEYLAVCTFAEQYRYLREEHSMTACHWSLL